MKQKHVDYQMVSYPKSRRFMAAAPFSPAQAHDAWLARSRCDQGALTSGTIKGEKPGVVDGHIALRDYLSLTISGAPAARFTQRLKELIESGYALFDSTVESGQAGAETATMKSERRSASALVASSPGSLLL